MDTVSAVRLKRRADALVEHYPWGRLTWVASERLGNSEEMTFGMCHILPGRANPRHYHPNCDEVLHVIEGRILHTLGDEEFEMGPGDTISIARNVPHNASNIGDVTAVLMIAFSAADRQVVPE